MGQDQRPGRQAELRHNPVGRIARYGEDQVCPGQVPRQPVAVRPFLFGGAEEPGNLQGQHIMDGGDDGRPAAKPRAESWDAAIPGKVDDRRAQCGHRDGQRHMTVDATGQPAAQRQPAGARRQGTDEPPPVQGRDANGLVQAAQASYSSRVDFANARRLHLHDNGVQHHAHQARPGRPADRCHHLSRRAGSGRA